MKSSVIRKTLMAFVIPIIVVIAWWFATTYNDIPIGILPTISMVGDAFMRQWNF